MTAAGVVVAAVIELVTLIIIIILQVADYWLAEGWTSEYQFAFFCKNQFLSKWTKNKELRILKLFLVLLVMILNDVSFRGFLSCVSVVVGST